LARKTRLIATAALAGSIFLGTATSAFADTPTSHTVVQSDTLWAIGLKVGTPWQILAQYNHLANPDLILVGEVIQVPLGSGAALGVTERPAVTSPARSNVTSESPRVATRWMVPTPQPVRSAPVQTGTGTWGCIAQHESGGNPATNTGNGYYGMYQDTQQSWVAGGGLAYAPRADLAGAAAQTAVNQRIQAMSGWGAWPTTSRLCGV
jgi:LysM repeat protein